MSSTSSEIRKAIVTLDDEITRLQKEQLQLAQQQFAIYQKLEACYEARSALIKNCKSILYSVE